MSTSESQVYARALYDALIGGTQQALKAAAKRLDGVQGDAATLEQQAIAALPADAPREARNFLTTLAREGKLDLLPAVLQSFEQYGQSNARPLSGEVISAVELDEQQRAKITNELRRRYGERLEVHFGVDPSLIGGLIIRIGDQVLDNSLRARLSAIQRNMLAS
ncbi:MAG TPA: ATP synthase F1 subunit delta [Roseiflexaceae bacterium]|nr:ATP synthase F1 subunit delta [Roseiflexaceae bacterium]